MSELTVEQIIKLILGITVVVVVIFGIYLIFKGRFMEFFKSLSPGNSTKLILSLIR
jgi:hypothetical protein